MAIFYRLLDMSNANSYILNESYSARPVMNIMQLLKALERELVVTKIRRRMENLRINQKLRMTVKRIVGKDTEVKWRLIILEDQKVGEQGFYSNFLIKRTTQCEFQSTALREFGRKQKGSRFQTRFHHRSAAFVGLVQVGEDKGPSDMVQKFGEISVVVGVI
ncbi:hypothetical protein AVEN_70911-1 [Araneus ventricosus]|uniref:Uncharacterized protein n=1 Tax=Araneus ventricosus TaxID=182803 RepID=A0A4Y2RFF7_ARAVE|nr:hypothetical protein AVEN_245287-1 [Araneus ventricosus]GBN74541.1 hypothetical protein AVEN_70911-1 [Araneus ventricosus]